MSCEKCDKAQEEGKAYFFRWNNANLLMSGCEEHIREAMNWMRKKFENEIPKPE